MSTPVSPARPRKPIARSMVGALIVAILAGGIALSSAVMPRAYAVQDTISVQDFPVYWYGSRLPADAAK